MLELTRITALLANVNLRTELHGTYRPERVVRRAGSEVHQRLPSRVGGQLIYRQEV